jgi:hypothetical protein
MKRMSAKVAIKQAALSTSYPNSKLLINELPLHVLPSLAAQVGLNEAIVLQQLHYWLLKSENIHDGHRWVYNTYKQWREDNFLFWSEQTIQRIFTSLEKQGVVVSRRLDARDWNQRKWYRIDYTKLDDLTEMEDPS